MAMQFPQNQHSDDYLELSPFEKTGQISLGKGFPQNNDPMDPFLSTFDN